MAHVAVQIRLCRQGYYKAELYRRPGFVVSVNGTVPFDRIQVVEVGL